MNLKKAFKIDESKFKERKPFEYLTNKANILKAIGECLIEGDLEGIMEVIKMHMEAVKMAKMCNEQQTCNESEEESKSYSSGGSTRYAGSSANSKKLT